MQTSRDSLSLLQRSQTENIIVALNGYFDLELWLLPKLGKSEILSVDAVKFFILSS